MGTGRGGRPIIGAPSGAVNASSCRARATTGAAGRAPRPELPGAISAAGSREFRLGWVPVFGMLAFIAFCAGIFVTGLHVPLPLFGTWFGR